MKQIQKIALIFFGGIFFLPTVFGAQISEEFRENLSDIIKDVCHSSINYSIDDSVGFPFFNTDKKPENICAGGKCAEYHQRINCVFNDALKIVTNDINGAVTAQNFKNSTQGKNKKKELETSLVSTKDFTIENCEGSRLEDVVSIQKNRGFVSGCADFETPNTVKPASACLVTEAVMLEFCGYQNFLLAKIEDKRSFEKEFQPLNGYSAGAPAAAKTIYANELKNAESSLFEMISFYRNYESTYRSEAWLQTIKFQLSVLLDKVTVFTKALAAFPAKFLNVSIN